MKKPCSLNGYRVFLYLFEGRFPLYFPLLAQNALNIGLHSGGAVLFHLVGDVTVYIKRKGSGSVS